MRIPPAAVSRETGERLDAFLALLLRWNARINLVAERDAETLRRRHVEDSLQLLPLLPPNPGPAADLGTGGGFPGLVLAIADTARPWHLVESDKRKAAFLLAASAELRLAHVTVHAARIENVTLPPLALLTARALAPLGTLLGHAARLLAPAGTALFPKGRNAEAELTAARADWTMEVARFESRTEPGATILRITGIHRAGP
ncbi:16S rRNA (guanine(527)-N(7))-methyltransferase RsmG [Roseomonas nepalensis]|uniref:Ribosomal RNA small subunit methyltransferase G n=1 Tax=Muricoccus nepalensis TaxID=1854500 RepID=A0A502G4U8_9PROT|nr:16S rRNA (guanine(527)-N(7))-methyltransferase RsmG [Roseomonas nepalensis]TPG56905.1 16S rRNA (guanine(527)-N(7))-methyltransferase RsmG [Roseomonas nepalensis]